MSVKIQCMLSVTKYHLCC